MKISKNLMKVDKFLHLKMLYSLCIDILLELFKLLEFMDVITIGKTCKKLNKLYQNNLLKILYHKDSMAGSKFVTVISQIGIGPTLIKVDKQITSKNLAKNMNLPPITKGKFTKPKFRKYYKNPKLLNKGYKHTKR